MARRPFGVVSMRWTVARSTTRTRPVRMAGFSHDTSASPRALIGHPKLEHNPQELQAGRPSYSSEFTAAGYGKVVMPTRAAPSASSWAA